MQIHKIIFLLCLLSPCSSCFSDSPKNLIVDEEKVSGFVTSGSIQIHYIAHRKNSSSPTLLFIPGLSMPAWIFDQQLQYFSPMYSVVAMDPRSQGESSQTPEGHYVAARAKDIKAVVDQLRLSPVILIGWSLAVSEVVSYLDQFGSRGVAGIVLIDGLVGCDMNNLIMNDMLSYWYNFQKNRRENTYTFVRGMFQQPQSEDYIEKLAAASLKTPTNTFMTLVYNMVFQDLRPCLPSITVPTLIFSSDNFWLKSVQEEKNLIQGACLEVIKEAGHALFVDQPQTFNHILEEFVKSTDGVPQPG